MDFPSMLASLLKTRSQQSLAKELGVSQAYICNLAKGNHPRGPNWALGSRIIALYKSQKRRENRK